MKKNIFITGFQDTGKTVFLRKIHNNENTIITSYANLKHLHFDLSEETQFLVFDEVQNVDDLKAIAKLSRNKELTFRKLYSLKKTTIKMPTILIESNAISIDEAKEILDNSAFKFIDANLNNLKKQ